MNAFRRLALAAALVVATAAPGAAMSAGFLVSSPVAPGRVDAAASAAESYFDFDALITLGALALAGGGLAAFGGYAAQRRREEEAALAGPGWRNSVFRAMQADLTQFAETLRRAA